MLTSTAALLHVVLHAQVLPAPPRYVLPRPAATAVRATAQPNRVAGGRWSGNTLTVSLDILESAWRPEGDREPEVPILAFAESGRSPTVPGPLLRVRRGSRVQLTLRNRSDSTIVVTGLRPGTGITTDTIQLAAGATRELRYSLDSAGTFYYYGAFPGLTSGDRFWKDSQLNGAIVVDEPGASTNDRVLVISEWFLQAPRVRAFESVLLINGKAWPHGETQELQQGDSVHFRVLNLTGLMHPMHLHGFYYRITAHGDGARQRATPAEQQPLTNTDLIPIGGTYNLSFLASTPGNWLYHCHFAFHIDETSTLHGAATDSTMPRNGSRHGSSPQEHMRGLAMGIRVAPRPDYVPTPTAGARRLDLFAQQRAARLRANWTARSFVLQRGPTPPALDSVELPSSVLELETGKPVRIMVHNRLDEPTAVHWHGLEIESFPDGVPHWSGLGSRVFTQVAARDSFAAEFTPPRAGTYPYHSHLNDRAQMTSGMYGALLVTDGPRDRTRDHLVVIGGFGPWIESGYESPYGAVNGSANPRPLVLAAGVTHRLRFVMLHPDWTVHIALQNDSTVARWSPLAKDGADLPPALRAARLARTTMSAGETADFEFTPTQPGEWEIFVRTDGLGWQAAQRLRVVAGSPPR